MMKKNILFLAILILTNFLVYRQICSFKPVNLDEQQLFTDNWQELKTGKTVSDIFHHDVFETTSGVFYRPMFILSFMMDARRSGEVFDPTVFHKTNLLIHIFNAVLCFALFIVLGYAPEFAIAGAFLFSLHPAIAGASAWIPGRNDSLLFLFTALSLLSLTGAVKLRNFYLFIAHLFFFLIALLTKESAVVLIAVFPIWTHAAGWRWISPKGTRLTVLLVASWLICLLIYWFMRSAVLKGSVTFPGFEELLYRTSAYAAYLFYPCAPPVYARFEDFNWTYIIFSNMVALVLVVIFRKRYIIPTLIATMYLFIIPAAFSDRFIPNRDYLPAFLFALALTELCYRFRAEKIKTLLLMAIVATYMGITTFYYIGQFKNPEIFWTNAYKKSPSAEAAYELGYQSHLRDDIATAEKYYLEALAKNSSVPYARNNLGVIYKNTGRYAQAMQLYEEELKLEPGKPLVLENIGNLLMIQGEYERAIAYYKQKISAEPGIAKTYTSLIFCLRKVGMNAEADSYTNHLATLQNSYR